MDWLRIHTKTLRGPEFVGSEPIVRATWLSILAYCVDQENGGIIPNSKEWGNRRWMQTIGVTLDEISDDTELFRWVDSDLHISFYPMSDQEKCVKNRENAKAGGKASGKARAQANGEANASSESGNSVEQRQRQSRVKEELEQSESRADTSEHARALDFFLNKGCRITDAGERTFFVGCYKKFSDTFLSKCIGYAKEQKESAGQPPKPYRSDIVLAIEMGVTKEKPEDYLRASKDPT